MAGPFFVLGRMASTDAAMVLSLDGHPDRRSAESAIHWQGSDDGFSWAICRREGPDVFRSEAGDIWPVHSIPYTATAWRAFLAASPPS